MRPRVSVIMATRNVEKYIRDCVDSVLAQSFEDFEFLIYDNQSTDKTVEILRSYRDPRILLEVHPDIDNFLELKNRGLSRARGEYIAFMDGDDICFPKRFETQLSFLESHPQVGICGSFALKIGLEEGLWRFSEDNESIKFYFLRSSQLIHPSTMARRSLFNDGACFDLSFRSGGSDYDLWVQLFEKTEFHNLSEPLIHYRIHQSNASVGRDPEFLRSISLRIRKRLYKKVFPELREDERELLMVLLSRDLGGIKSWDSLEELYERLRTSTIQHIDQERLFEELDRQIFRFAFRNTKLGIRNYLRYRAVGTLGKPKSLVRELDLIYKSIFSIPKRKRRVS